MIHINCYLGEFKIDEGELVFGNEQIEQLFRIATIEPPAVSEGPVDYAIAMRMMAFINEKYVVLDEQDPPLERNAEY